MKPVHDDYSHDCDSLRTFCEAWHRNLINRTAPRKTGFNDSYEEERKHKTIFAGFHHKEGLFEDEPIAKNLHILTLPPQSPELNPVEKRWDVLLKTAFARSCGTTLTDLEEQITSTLKELWERADGFTSLFTNSRLRSELNAPTLSLKVRLVFRIGISIHY